MYLNVVSVFEDINYFDLRKNIIFISTATYSTRRATTVSNGSIFSGIT